MSRCRCRFDHRDALAKARPDARVVTVRTANHVLKTAPADYAGNVKTYTDRALPLGWKDAGRSGPKQECLAFIKEVWTDMRPLSLRKQMEAREQVKSSC